MIEFDEKHASGNAAVTGADTGTTTGSTTGSAPSSADENLLSLLTPSGSAAISRHPPANIEIEQALLGALLRDNRKFDQISDLLSPACFAAPEHQKIFHLMKRQIDRGQEARPTTLRHLIQNDPLLAESGGSDYLVKLSANVITVINVADYAKTLLDLYLKRQLIEIGEIMVNDAYDQDLDETGTDQIEKAENSLYQLATTGEVNKGAIALSEAANIALQAAESAYGRDDHIIGVDTGLRDINNMLGGFHPSDLIVIAGRPSMGKTALATNIAFNAARAYRRFTDKNGQTLREGGKVLFFSLEMSSDQLATRIISQNAKVSGDKIRRGDVTEDQFLQISEAVKSLKDIPLYIDDTPALSITAVRQRARRLKRQFNIDMIIVDYLQLLQGPAGKRIDNRVQEISEITRGLKTLAKELDVPVVALSQLSRMVEHRENKRPQLADLRESGSIEQDADVVAFVYREEYYLQREQPQRRPNEGDLDFETREKEHSKALENSRNIAEFNIAKQRHGPTGNVPLYFNGDQTYFSDLDPHHGKN